MQRVSHLEKALAPNADHVRVEVERGAVRPVFELGFDPVEFQRYVHWLCGNPTYQIGHSSGIRRAA